jgi:acyl dehydratase
VVSIPLTVDTRRRLTDAARARGEPVAAMGPALGFRELRWMKPVYVDDTVDYTSEIVAARASESRPGVGLVSFRTTGTNQRGEPVISFISTTFVERRPVAP